MDRRHIKIWENFPSQGQTLVDTENEIKDKESQSNKLIVYNDNVNTFDHVISCLVDFCNHSEIQAEQCAMIIHYKGKCQVKSGSYEELEPICTELLENGLTAEII